MFPLRHGRDPGAAGCLRLPRLAYEEASQPAALADERQAVGTKRVSIVGEPMYLEPGEKMEGRIETANEELRGNRKEAVGDRKL